MELCPRFGLNSCMLPVYNARLAEARNNENGAWRQKRYKDANDFKQLQGKIEGKIQKYIEREDVRRVFADCLSTCPLLLTGSLNIQFVD